MHHLISFFLFFLILQNLFSLFFWLYVLVYLVFAILIHAFHLFFVKFILDAFVTLKVIVHVQNKGKCDWVIDFDSLEGGPVQSEPTQRNRQ